MGRTGLKRGFPKVSDSKVWVAIRRIDGKVIIPVLCRPTDVENKPRVIKEAIEELKGGVRKEYPGVWLEKPVSTLA